MTVNSQQLLAAFDQTCAFVQAEQDKLTQFAPVARLFEEKRRTPDAVVMIYGVYNAGKSTLINALLGREEAATGDIPLTDKVSAYEWDAYSILDTPGVDAPIEHELVTRSQMLQADAVIFVVDPVGTAEESKTLQVLLDLVHDGKQVFMVFNEKKEVSDAEYITLKDRTRTRLQEMAAESGRAGVLKDIPMVKINARRALQGRLKGQVKLLELSGFPPFEAQLRSFLQGITQDEIYGRLKQSLTSFLNTYIDALHNRAHSDVGQKYDKLLRGVSLEKSRLAQSMGRELRQQRQDIYEKCKVYMRTGQDDCKPKLELLLQQAGEHTATVLEHEMTSFIASVDEEIEAVQAAMPRVEPRAATVQVPELANVGGPRVDSASPAGLSVDTAALKDVAQQLGSLAKPEHIVSGLKLVKETLPSLMKGIGIKTMEKWAGALAGKWIPYFGTGISAAQALYGLFAGDPEAERLQRETQERERVRERVNQQIEDFAVEIATGYETSMWEIVQKQMEEFFGNVALQVELLRHAFSEAEQAQTRSLEQLLAIQQVAEGA